MARLQEQIANLSESQRQLPQLILDQNRLRADLNGLDNKVAILSGGPNGAGHVNLGQNLGQQSAGLNRNNASKMKYGGANTTGSRDYCQGGSPSLLN